MGKLPSTQNNLKQPSPDDSGLEKAKPNDLDLQAAQVNRDIPVLAKKSRDADSKKRAPKKGAPKAAKSKK